MLHHIETQWQTMDSPELRLRNALNKIIHAYDYIIIDCPPESDCLLKNAFNVTDYYVLPVLPDANSFQELAPTISQIKDLTTVEKQGNILGCVINESRKQKITIDNQKLDMKELYNEIINVFNVVVPMSIHIDNSFANNMPIPFYHRNVKNCDKVFSAFRNLTKEILEKINAKENSVYA